MTNGSSIHQKEKTLTDNDGNSKAFLFCSKKDHKWSDCKTETKVEDRKKMLS